ncbi:MAG: hypothetical protein JST00_12580 [Deltaproteobacteria bacterium]|nr:hypothetical protein [Deltaproteobacteria bacterium]
MSGTQTLFEAKLSLQAPARAAFLGAIAKVPTVDGRIDVTETKTRVDVRAFFSVDAEARAERLVGACRAAASRGAKGEGILFVLVDYQRESGARLALANGRCVVTALSQKEVAAKHAKLDRLLEDAIAPAASVASGSDPKVLAAAEAACRSLEAFPREELGAAFARVKATTVTTAAFGVSKKQEKTLPRLEGTWPWREAMPVRLYAELDPKAAEPMAIGLLEAAALLPEERFLIIEALSRSTSDEALAIVAHAQASPDPLLANAAHRALAFSEHPRASQVLVERARAWLASLRPETLPQHPDLGALAVLAGLQLRNDAATRAMLREIWQTFFEARARIPLGAYALPVAAAQAYVTATAQGRAQTAGAVPLPGPNATLEAWAEVVTNVERPR